MKILSVTGNLSDNAASWRICNIVKLLRAIGHEVHLVQYTRKSTLATVSQPTIHIRHLRELSKDNYDLVYGNTHFGAFWSILGRLKGIPLIFDMHGGMVEEFLLNNQSNSGWNHSLLTLYEYFLGKVMDFVDLRFSNKIICVSKKMIQYLHEEKGVPIEKIAYVTNGVDLDFFKPMESEQVQFLKRSLSLEDKFVVGYIGDFAKWQGAENFIEAAELIDDPRLAFVIVGGEKESRKSNILFIPKVPRSKIPSYYSICDVLVLPRPNHPATEIAAPTKFCEYTAMGRPVLTTNVGDASDLVRKYNCGVAVKNNSPNALVRGILEFKSTSKDELAAMGRNSRRLAESEFDWNKVAIELEKAVSDAVK